jgi:hypothetical protein
VLNNAHPTQILRTTEFSEMLVEHIRSVAPPHEYINVRTKTDTCNLDYDYKNHFISYTLNDSGIGV